MASFWEKLTRLHCSGARASSRGPGLIGVLLGVAALALAGGPARGQAEPPRPMFNETTCDLPGVTPEVLPRLRCGTVSVPRNYDHPGAGQFSLAVVTILSEQQPALPDPVVYISGGPGSPLTISARYKAGTQYARARDLILVDQRGTGRSEPNLCPDLDPAFFDAAIAVATDPSDKALAMRRSAHASCRAEAIAHGFDPKDFGTSVTVADFEWVRRALGIEHWNVYSESYGTTVAMTLVALHPGTVRATVLDSIYPPDPEPLRSSSVQDALDALFRYCAGDQPCAAAFPDLAETYRDTLARLAQAPLTVAVPPQMHRPGDRMDVTSSLLEAVVSRLIYYPSAWPGLPRLIATLHDGDSQGLGKILATAFASAAAEVNYAMYLAVQCRDRPYFRDKLPPGANVVDHLQPYGLCDEWSELGPMPLVPAGTAVPVLVLSGEFDPVARPSQSRQVTAQIGPNARWVEFPRIGHNVRAFSPCGAKIAADFIADPARLLDTSCTGRAAPIRFLAKQDDPSKTGR